MAGPSDHTVMMAMRSESKSHVLAGDVSAGSDLKRVRDPSSIDNGQGDTTALATTRATRKQHILGERGGKGSGGANHGGRYTYNATCMSEGDQSY